MGNTSVAGLNASGGAVLNNSHSTLNSGSLKELRLSRRLSVSSLLFGMAPAVDGELPSAMEFVVKSFCAEWLALADAKLREFWSGGDAVPLSALDFTTDEKFNRLLDSLGRVSKRILGSVVVMVLSWRKNKIKDMVLTGQRGAMLTVDDRVLLGTEFLCCTTLVSILKSVVKESLDDAEWCLEVEQTCFQNVVPSRGNTELIREKYALALGCLAPFRLPSITAKFKQAVQQFQQNPNAKNQQMIEPILEAMSHLKLDISNQVNYMGVSQLLTVFVDLLLQTKGKHEEIRPLLVQTMVSLLRPLLKVSSALPSGVDYTKWFQFVNATYAALYSKLVEPKNPRESRTPNYPLLVTLLCLQERELFLSTYSSLADHITAVKTIKKDKKTGDKLNFSYLLEAVLILVKHFTTQEWSKKEQQASSQFLEMVTLRLLEIRDPKLGPLPNESVQWMVEILSAMARKSTLLTLRELSKLLVASGPGKEGFGENS